MKVLPGRDLVKFTIRQSPRLVHVAALTIAGSLGTSSALAGEARSQGYLEEVIVTAQKREEQLQEVPISISVLNGADLDRFTGAGVSEALALVPGVKITQEGILANGNAQISVRGVSASGATFNGSSPVAYYIDSVPFGLVKTAVAPDTNAYDLERVEVLRGPQGTLYGANALNGVVRILTKNANLNAFEFKTRGSISTTERGGENYRGDLAVNVPLVEGKLAARAVLGYNDMSGWIDKTNEKDANDSEVRSARVKVNAQPTDKLSIGLSAWLSRSDFGSPSLSDDEDRFPGTISTPMSTDYDLFGLTVAYDFPGVSLTSMTSYIDYANDGGLDLSSIGFTRSSFTGFDSGVFAQELVLNSTHAGPWRWSLGAFYRDAEDRLFQEAESLQFPVDFGDTSESLAVFGQITRLVLDGKLELTAGLRYFRDDVTEFEHLPFDGDTTRPLFNKSERFDDVSPRLVVTWHPTDNTTFYGSYSEGFRSGFNQNSNIALVVPGFAPVKEDTLKNYELGAKGGALEGRISWDAAVYYIDWQNVQQTVSVEIPTGSGAFFTALINGESASGMGVDYGMTLVVADGLDIGLGFSWNDLQLDEGIVQNGVLLFEKGDRLNYSSEYTAAASIGYTFSLSSSGLEARFEAAGNYSSKFDTRTLTGTNPLVGEGDAILEADVRFSISSPDRWDASLFVDNVSNERNAPVRPFHGFGLPYLDSRIRPRTIGVQFEYRY